MSDDVTRVSPPQRVHPLARNFGWLSAMMLVGIAVVLVATALTTPEPAYIVDGDITAWQESGTADGWWSVVVTGWALVAGAAIGLSVTLYEVIDRLMKHVDSRT